MYLKSADIKILIKTLTSLLMLLVIFVSHIDIPTDSSWGQSGEELFWAELNECTTGVVSGSASQDGRPLLWKNRDVGNSNQEFQYVDDGRIPFISITYSNEDDEYYGGINAAGFAVENSNSYNLPPGPAGNIWGYGDDDGEIHMLALATCRTVDDFQEIMEWTNEFGRTLNSNYGTLDAFGGAAMFEAAGYQYTRIDAEDTPDGFIVRSNYSYSGDGLDNRSSSWGPNRHDTAYDLWKWAADHSELTAKYIYQATIRNIHLEGMNDYSMPYEGFWEDYPYGAIPNGEAICRSTTRGVLVAQGVRAGERPDDAILWAMCGSPLGGIATPLWVRACSSPEEYDSPNGSRICDRADEITDWVYITGNYGRAVDTWRLVNPEGTGYWDWSIALEDWVFNKVDEFVNSPTFSYDRLQAFQNETVEQVADAMEDWNPSTSPTEISELVFVNNHILLRWGGIIEPVFGIHNQPRGYNIHRSDQPFRINDRGQQLAHVEDNYFIDEEPLEGRAFYRVEAVF